MSQAELHIIRARLDGGIRNKGRSGRTAARLACRFGLGRTGW